MKTMTRALLLSALALVAVAGLARSAHALLMGAIELEQLAVDSDAIVQGVVGSSTSFRASDGKQLRTLTQIEVRGTLKGEVPTHIEVITPGGAVDGIGQKVSGLTSFVEGEELVLFLKANRRLPGRFALNAMDLGKFAVERRPTGERFVKQERAGISFLAQDGSIAPAPRFEPMPEELFLDRVRSALVEVKP